jgi:hypothetical protein
MRAAFDKLSEKNDTLVFRSDGDAFVIGGKGTGNWQTDIWQQVR